MRRVKGKQDARCASAEARHLQRELEDLRDENARLEKQVATLGELLKSTAEARDRLLRERMELNLRDEARRRCDKVSAPSVQQIPKLPTKADWSLEGPTPAQVQATRKIDGSRDSGLLRDSYWEEQPCRFSGDGREGCFVAPVNRHGGPCVPCWARARQRLWEQKTEIAGLKQGGKP